jgi:hypothetical protein
VNRPLRWKGRGLHPAFDQVPTWFFVLLCCWPLALPCLAVFAIPVVLFALAAECWAGEVSLLQGRHTLPHGRRRGHEGARHRLGRLDGCGRLPPRARRAARGQYGRAWGLAGADALAGQISLAVELVLAFHGGLDDPKRGNGTRHMIQIARSGCSLG